MRSGQIPHPTFLEGRLLRLVPLEEEHIAPLLEISRSTPDEFSLTSTPVTDEEAEFYFRFAFGERAAGRAYPFVALDRETEEVVGSTRFADIRWRHRGCELGYTWFKPSLHGTGVNIESKLLMLGFAFERLGFVRVQIHTDTRNVRSQRAIRALGASYEGILRRHMIARDGYIRDTMVFSVVDLEWPSVKRRLVERLRARGHRPPLGYEGEGEGN